MSQDPAYTFSWQDTLSEFPGVVPLRQHPHYAAAMRSYGVQARYLCVFDGQQDVVAAFLVLQRRVLWQRLALIMDDGLWWRKPRVQDQFFQCLKRALSPLGLVIWDTAQTAASASGFRALTTPRHSLWLDISGDLGGLRKEMDGKWRNGLKKAEASAVALVKETGASWLYDQDKAQQRQKRFLALPSAFAQQFVTAGDAVILSARQDHERVAGALFLIHGETATYHIGWSSDKGRKVNAANLLLWEGIKYLKSRGVKALDLGDSDKTNPGLMRFKLGIGKIKLIAHRVVI